MQRDGVNLVNRFMQQSIIQRSARPEKPDEWVELTTYAGTVWEHTQWLTATRLDEDLRPIFLNSDTCQFIDVPDYSLTKRNAALLRRRAPFVVLLNDKGELKAVIERKVLLERVADQLVSQESGE
jgi:hypothetical protein